MKKFIYNGIYYPVIGCSATCFEGSINKVAWSKKLGGYLGKWSWLPYIGIRCKVSNRNKPYKQFVIDAITNHPEMRLLKWYYEEKDPKMFMWIVNSDKGHYIGNIYDAYYTTDLTALTTVGGPGSGIQVGYNKKNKTAYGWSHRAKCGFKIGDKLFEEDFGDDDTIYSQHGKKTIRTYADQMKAAANFAKHVS